VPKTHNQFHTTRGLGPFSKLAISSVIVPVSGGRVRSCSPETICRGVPKTMVEVSGVCFREPYWQSHRPSYIIPCRLEILLGVREQRIGLNDAIGINNFHGEIVYRRPQW
jgi:hypothetical protein